MKKIIWILVGIVLVAAAGFGGFEEGKAYQSNQANQIRNQFLQSRGLNPNAFSGQNGGAPNGGGRGGFGGGVTGNIKDIQGSTLDLSTATDVTTVNLSTSTQIEKTIPATSADLKAGVRLIVRGSRNADGSLAADQIQIVNNGGAAQSSAQITPAP